MLYDAHKDGSISRHPFGFHLIDWRMRLCQRVSASCRPSTIYCSRCTMCNIVLSALQVPAGNPKGCFRFSASFGLFFVAVLYRMQQSGRTRLIYTSSAGLRHTTRKQQQLSSQSSYGQSFGQSASLAAQYAPKRRTALREHFSLLIFPSLVSILIKIPLSTPPRYLASYYFAISRFRQILSLFSLLNFVYRQYQNALESLLNLPSCRQSRRSVQIRNFRV